jgi:hypothetical protein
MGEVRCRQGYDIRFCDHTLQFARLRKHDVPQVLHKKVKRSAKRGRE